jgi:hypothetical protein
MDEKTAKRHVERDIPERQEQRGTGYKTLQSIQISRLGKAERMEPALVVSLRVPNSAIFGIKLRMGQQVRTSTEEG